MRGRRGEKQIIDPWFRYQDSVVMWYSLTLHQQCLCIDMIDQREIWGEISGGAGKSEIAMK